MSSIGQDIRFALRSLAKTPSFTAIALLSLALGIGANTAIFSLMDQVLLRQLPVERPEELFRFQHKGSSWGRVEGRDRYSFPMYRDIRDRAKSFSALAAHYPASLSLSAEGGTERVAANLVTGNYFTVLGIRPAIGRLLSPEDDRTPGAHPVAVLTHGFWTRRFGADPGVLNKPVRINNQPMTVVGVTQRGFKGTDVGRSVDVMVPVMMKAKMTPTYDGLEDRRSLWLLVMGRLKPGVTTQQGEAELASIIPPILEDEAKGLPIQIPAAIKRFKEQKIVLAPGGRGTSDLREQFSTSLIALMCMVGVMLLIACANVANLLLARAATRRKEIAIRVSLGAGRGRIIRQLLVESVLLSVVGGGFGLLVAAWMGSALLNLIPILDSAPSLSADPDGRILAFTLAVAVLTGILFGLVPALNMTRTETAAALKDQSAGMTQGGRHVRMRKVLVVTQVALSLMLLISAGLFTRSLYNLKTLDPGFRSADVLTFSIDPSLNGYTPERSLRFLNDLRQRLERMPGVGAASLSDTLLVAGNRSMATVTVEGYRRKSDDEDLNPDLMTVGPGYFKTLGMPLVLGRDFNDRDVEGAAKVALINEAMAKYFFKGENPIGRRFALGHNKPDTQIIGVVRDGKVTDMRDEPRRRFYLSHAQAGPLASMTYYVRSNVDASSLVTSIRSEIGRLDSALPVYAVTPLRIQIDDSLFMEQMVALLSCCFGFVATLLAAIGLYGVMAYMVSSRTKEIGIRMALGASRNTVMSLVMREVGWMAVIGIAIAVPAAWGLSRFVKALLYGLEPNDVPTMVIATILVAAIALLAGYLPASRAGRVDPIVALRYE